MSGGRRALGNHDAVRDVVLDVVRRYLTGDVMSFSVWVDAGRPVDCVVVGFPFEGIYGPSDARGDIVLVHPGGWRARLVLKWQNTSGSTDEKFPFVLEQAFRVPEDFVVILVGGAGPKPAAVDWLVRAAAHRSSVGSREVVVVRSLDELEGLVSGWSGGWVKARRRSGSGSGL